MKVLVYTPMLRLYGRALQSILRLEWDGQLDINFCKGGNPPVKNKAEAFQVVTAKYNHARNLALNGGYDALLTIEDDMIVPPDAIKRLVATEADIAYGLYCWRNQNNHKWSAYTVLEDAHGVSISDDREAAQSAWGKVIDVAGIGMGCTLIRKRVLRELKFRVHKAACSDWGLALDAQEHGFTQRCDLGVVCGHMTTHNPSSRYGSMPWILGMTGSPRIIWPDPDLENTGKLYRIEYLDV